MKIIPQSLAFEGSKKTSWLSYSIPGTLTNSVLNGLKWSYASSLTIGILQIGLTAVLARLLEPRSFGLVAMAGIVLRFGSYFAQMGMVSAIVQKPNLRAEDVRIAFTYSTGLSLVFFSAFWLGSPVAAWLFDSPELSFLLPVMAFSFVFTGISATAVGLLRRGFKFHLLGMAEIFGYIIGYGFVGVPAAVSGAGAWSLVYAALTQSGVVALLAVAFTRHQVKPLFSWTRGQKLASFGGKVSTIGFLEFLTANLDALAIGKIMGAASLGLYNRAYMLVNLPMYYFSSSLARVLLPSFSKVQNDKKRLERSFRAAMLLMGALLFPLCFGIVGGARELVLAILGEQWKESIPILRVLALSTPFMLLTNIEAVLLEATANLMVKLYIQIAIILILCMLFVTLFPYGLVGMASAVLVSSVALFIAYTAALKKLLFFSQQESYLNVAKEIFCGCIILLGLSASSEAIANLELNMVLALIVQLLLGGVIYYLLLVSPLQRSLRTELQRILSHLKIDARVLRTCQRLLWL